jgi:apolipoprotein N-acyltransferase
MSFVTLAIGAAPGIWRRDGGRSQGLVFAGAFLALALLWGGGALRLLRAAPPPAHALRLRIVQPNIGQAEKWTPEALRSIIERYAMLTNQTGGQPADVIIWPEGAIPDVVEDFLAPDTWSRALITDALVPGQILLFGADRQGDPAAGPSVYYNSLLAMRRTASDLQVIGHYDKHHLVPFGEYMPFDRWAAAVGFKALVHLGDGFTPGPASVAMSVPGLAPLQPLICYESLFPGSFARTGPRPLWIANVSNDAWFGETSGPWQHLNLASYRAIEEGVPVVRATPTGVSAVVDAYGRTKARLGLGQAGVIDADLPPALAPTPFSRWRDIPFWLLCAVGMMIGVVDKITRKWRFAKERIQ